MAKALARLVDDVLPILRHEISRVLALISSPISTGRNFVLVRINRRLYTGPRSCETFQQENATLANDRLTGWSIRSLQVDVGSFDLVHSAEDNSVYLSSSVTQIPLLAVPAIYASVLVA